ncbi:MAG: MATE family efflux transporter [Oscillospiraceae bacterium]|jgi:putative MATE family efflux protein|nr:MATE family efflux transporter [Oscillospiraceae bacterium]
MVKDMTKGSPLKLIVLFVLPLVLGNLFQQIYNLADAFIVGRTLGADAFGAVGSTAALFFLVVGFSGGLTAGFGVRVAQLFGAGDYKQMRKYIANSVYLSAIFSIVITVLTVIFTKELLTVTKTPDTLYAHAYNYIIVIFAGLGTIFLYNICAAICRALGDSRTPLIFLMISCVLNIVLSFVLIKVFHMGTEGSALGTVIAQLASGVMCLVFMKKKFAILKFEKGEWAIDTSYWGKLIIVGLPMALQFSITAMGNIILQTAVNSLGNSVVIATTAAYKVQGIAILPMEAIGVTLATFCGQNLGAGKYSRIITGIKIGTLISMGYCMLMGVIMFFGGVSISELFLGETSPEINTAIVRFMHLTAPYYCILGILFIFRNTLQGLGYGMMPMLGGVMELFARAYVSFGLIKSLGFDAVCYGGPIAWLSAALLVTIAYFFRIKTIRTACGERKKSFFNSLLVAE